MLREYSSPAITPTTDDDTIYSLLKRRCLRNPDDVVVEVQDESGRSWNPVTAAQMVDKVRSVAKGLLGLGVRKGSSVVIYAPTSYEWGIVDFACAAIGAVSVPIYDTDSAAQARGIVTEVRPVIAFAGGVDRAQILDAVRPDCESLKYVFNFEASGIDAVVDFGENVSDEQLDVAIDDIRADDLSTIVYTSGSTGKPKGVMLTNRNFTSIVLGGYDCLPNMLAGDPTRLLLFLPLAHCFARYIQYVAIGSHGVIGYLPGAKHLLADLRSFKPTYLLGVPRVFEKVYNAASQKAGSGFKGRVFLRAFEHFVQWSKDEQEGKGHGLRQRIEHAFYERSVGNSIRSALGPNLRFLACGGAPMNDDLAHFFNGLDGITFIQGYGMTETAAPCIVNFEAANRVGSVGKPGTADIAVRLSDDDELEVKGPNVFVGYKDDPQRTAEAFTDDGWLLTGDLAQIDDDGFVYITGRKKDLIITAGGKNVSPAPLEDVIGTCPIVSHVVVVGDGRPFISALVTLDPDMLSSWLESQGLDATMSAADVSDNDAVRAFIQQYVDQANSSVSRAESVRKFCILDGDFEQDDGTLTPSMKVVRPAVLRIYADVIDKVLYAPKQGARNAKGSSSQQLLEKATESISPLIDKAQESALPRLKEATERLEPVLDQAKSVSGSLANASRRLRAADSESGVESDAEAESTDGLPRGEQAAVRGDAGEPDVRRSGSVDGVERQSGSER
ncbi:AMP-binding protein [Bifidobacterium margollesii]|uniref:Acyl-CoA synthetase n=1 Tax=Bifidobacterium margollesii TaxID=2020964 RepID=A0A2N5J747_9BIFI|nr:AMP-dependent synthetase/ligase [Bifidobacterium margollesii]PLS30035.1 AMP-binding protein [Bifidobacterium margollesii]